MLLCFCSYSSFPLMSIFCLQVNYAFDSEKRIWLLDAEYALLHTGDVSCSTTIDDYSIPPTFRRTEDGTARDTTQREGSGERERLLNEHVRMNRSLSKPILKHEPSVRLNPPQDYLNPHS